MASHFLISGGVGRLFFWKKKCWKIYFQMAGQFLISGGVVEWKLLTSRLEMEYALRGLKIHSSGWGPWRVFFFICGGVGRPFFLHNVLVTPFPILLPITPVKFRKRPLLLHVSSTQQTKNLTRHKSKALLVNPKCISVVQLKHESTQSDSIVLGP